MDIKGKIKTKNNDIINKVRHKGIIGLKNKLIIIKFLINFYICTCVHKNDNNLIKSNVLRIQLKIKGVGYGNIYYSDYHNKPNEVYINEINQSIINYKYYFNKSENYVELIYKYNIYDCSSMFKDCINITENDLSNFDISHVRFIDKMFYGCSQLTSLNLINMKTSKIENMSFMFYGCSSLIFLDLSYFDTSKVITMNSMFYGCKNLKYINIKNFSIHYVKYSNYANMFYNISDNITICVYDSYIIRELKNSLKYFKIDCYNDWKKYQKIFYDEIICSREKPFLNIKTLECTNDCTNSEIAQKECIVKYIKNKNTEDETTIKNKLNKKRKLGSCGGSTEDDKLYGSCANKNNNQKLTTIINEPNGVEQNLKIEFKNPFLYLDIQNCVSNCTINKFLNNLCEIKYEHNETKEGKDICVIDLLIKNFETYLTSDFLNISNLENLKDEVFKSEKIIITLTTSKSQNNSINSISISNNLRKCEINTNSYNNTLIDIDICETLLRRQYNIPDDEFIFIKKLDVFEKGMKIPKVEYYIYIKSLNKTLINKDISICSNTTIDLFIPVEINDNIDKLNGSSGYYNDICYISDDIVDIPMKDRKMEFINKNKTLCQDDCYLSYYDFDLNISKCSCKTKSSPLSFANMKINKTKLLENFKDIENVINIKILKCYSILFTKNIIINNIGSFTIIPIIFFHFISIIIFYKNNFSIIKNKINDIFNILRKSSISKDDNKDKTNNLKITQNKHNKKKQKKNTINKRKKKYKQYKKTKKINNNIISNNNVNSINLNNKKIKQNIINRTEYNSAKRIIQKSKSKSKKVKKIMEYNDEEMNGLSYNMALKNDKRSFCMYYISLLKTKHILIFSFINKNDYNSRIIKMDLFFISFSIYMTINALFFNDDSMHKIYENNGSFNIEYQIAQIIYSTLISIILNIPLNLLAISNGSIIKFKHRKYENKNILNESYTSLNKNLKIKFLLFFIINFIFIVFFWVYLSIFCSIYKNTQYHLIKDTLISFGLSLIYPLGIYLLPGIFRISSLSKKKKCLYNFSKILQII